VLSGIAYRALSVVLDSRARIEQENRKWRGLALFFARFEQDVVAAATRPVRDAGDMLGPTLMGNAAAVRVNEGAIIVSRTTLDSARDAADPPRRLGYRLRAGVVELLTWDVLDQAARRGPAVTAVLRDVQALEFRYLDRRGQWHLAWPPATTARPTTTGIPAAVEATVTLASGERLVRLFPTSARLSQ
jgi:general secretion pathway protein J